MPGKPMRMYEDCMGTLGARNQVIGRKSIYEASEYVYVAVLVAEQGYFLTVFGMMFALDNASIPGEEKAAYELCIHDYQEADAAMNRTSYRLERVRKGLPEHCGVNLGDEYRAALRGLGACRDSLAKLPNSPLLDVVKNNYDRTMVAYMVGKLIGIK
ncbi:hypothetical protein HU200_004265 [Digitaria exilis]|uniref:Uncharacterized protein n=1 Tax=Digitaria exilis TaxID=1010633 RepID=A0A835E6Y1_9POAL|nr:hypothetical protein HU200_050977 [Digitaria exilis]KAF8775744.1 hypothetical protein HU200_004265 [Digitaria exilis]